MGYPRIEYNNIRIDFDQHFNDFQIDRVEKIFENEAPSGVIETIDFFERHVIRAVKERLSPKEIDQLEEWWRYVKDGSSFSLWLDRDVGLYLGFEGGSLKTNDELDATFDRTGAAYCVATDGVVRSSAEDYARFEDGKIGAALLIEEGSTNILVRSYEFDNASWTKTNVTVGADTTDVIDPARTNKACKLTSSAANATCVQATATAINNNDGCFSIWILARDYVADGIKIKIYDDSPSELASETLTPTGEWTRYDVEFNSVGANANNWQVEIEIINNNDVYYVFGAQLEVGTHHRYPSGYIETEAAAASRNNETVYWSVSKDVEIGQRAGTFAFWVYQKWLYNEGGGGGSDPARTFLIIVDSAGNNILDIMRDTSSNIRLRLWNTENSTADNITGTAATLTQSSWNHIVCTYDLDARTAYIYLNGAQIGTSTTLTTNAFNTMSKMYLGSSETPDNYADCLFDDLLITKDQKSASWVLKRYTEGNNSSYPIYRGRRNYFSSLMINDSEFNPIIERGGHKSHFELNAKEVLT